MACRLCLDYWGTTTCTVSSRPACTESAEEPINASIVIAIDVRLSKSQLMYGLPKCSIDGGRADLVAVRRRCFIRIRYDDKYQFRAGVRGDHVFAV
jgi:hypothetical protein